MSNEKKCYANVGGQAVMEGIMMRSPKKCVLAVRQPDGTVATEEIKADYAITKKKFFKLPIIRGCVSFVTSMLTGYKALTRSASLAGLEEETKGNKVVEAIVMTLSMVLGVALAVGLFMVLPTTVVWLLTEKLGLELGVFRALVEGVIRIALFVLYVVLVARMKDIKRLFQYHGAEHKAIFCFEANEDLTVENVRKQSRLHPRCGTAFIFLVLIISILFASFITWDSLVIRVLLKVLLLPVVAGLSFECIRYAGRHDNILTKIISAPGKAMQKITTAEPEDEMIEVAIIALTESLRGDDGQIDKSCAYTK